jgi:choline dehydrogenase-like flavoprotein
MFHDARQLDAGAQIEVDVCIVGAGAAGIAIARELLGQQQRVALLTSGGLEFAHAPQRLYSGEYVGRPGYYTPYRTSARMFGGATTRWTGHCRPLQPLDFERRDWVPHSGWPFAKDVLDPYYRRAHEVCRLGPFDYALSTWANGTRPLPVDPLTLDLRIYQFAHPTDFGKIYRGELEAARNVDVWLNANVLEIDVDADVRRVTDLRVVTAPGKEARFVARRYVLACGGLENPRLLLASNRVASGGLGNQHDLVGRFYTDHAFLFTGWFEPSRPDTDRTLNVIEDYKKAGSVQRAHAALALPERTIREEGLNDCAVYLIRRPGFKTEPAYFTVGVKSLRQLANVLKREDRVDRSLGRHLINVAFGLPAVGATAARRLIEAVSPRPRLAVKAVVETTPNPASRVTLGDRRDALGMPSVRVDWRINSYDRRGPSRLFDVLRPELARLGLGRLVENRAVDSDGWPVSLSSGLRHMGTTRMHDDPRQGVVDASCRVHDLANLYVAGGSVFPTGGVANPTLTTVALAIRLADHLKQTADVVQR